MASVWMPNLPLVTLVRVVANGDPAATGPRGRRGYQPRTAVHQFLDHQLDHLLRWALDHQLQPKLDDRAFLAPVVRVLTGHHPLAPQRLALGDDLPTFGDQRSGRSFD